DSLHMMTALPRIDGVEDADDLAVGCRDLVDQVAQAWQGEPVAEVRMLPEQLPWDTLPAISYDGRDHRIPIGIDELELDTVFLNPDSDPHFVVFGGPETGKTTLLRSILHGITTRYTPKEAKIVLLDYKRTLLGVVDTPHLLKYCASAAAATPVIKDCAGAIKARLPGSDVTTQQLRDKSWWKGSQLFIVVDDYERVAVSSGNALQPLAEFVVDGNDVGLHIIIARGMGGAGRATFSDQIITRMKESMNPGLIMSGSRDEGQLLADVRPSKLPSGRGTLVTKEDKYLIQTAVMPPVELD
ncbi:MAG: FtsK/SpoIIIE domain-containing protein, partial [Micrococcales bacterium]|nr:FtsK/SpoIIIE domain-containing protein [Micrococcales bacterium]